MASLPKCDFRVIFRPTLPKEAKGFLRLDWRDCRHNPSQFWFSWTVFISVIPACAHECHALSHRPVLRIHLCSLDAQYPCSSQAPSATFSLSCSSFSFANLALRFASCFRSNSTVELSVAALLRCAENCLHTYSLGCKNFPISKFRKVSQQGLGSLVQVSGCNLACHKL